jgi:hypothetical protein
MLSLRTWFFAMVFVACSSEAAPWRIEVTSQGGIHGRGAGTFVLDSTGAYSVTDIHGKRCSFKPSAARKRELAAAVANAKPRAWKASYVPDNTCCDRIEWTLTLDDDGTKSTTRWMEPAALPKDLAALVDTLRRLRIDHVCR